MTLCQTVNKLQWQKHKMRKTKGCNQHSCRPWDNVWCDSYDICNEGKLILMILSPLFNALCFKLYISKFQIEKIYHFGRLVDLMSGVMPSLYNDLVLLKLTILKMTRWGVDRQRQNKQTHYQISVKSHRNEFMYGTWMATTLFFSFSVLQEDC